METELNCHQNRLLPRKYHHNFANDKEYSAYLLNLMICM